MCVHAYMQQRLIPACLHPIKRKLSLAANSFNIFAPHGECDLFVQTNVFVLIIILRRKRLNR